MLLDQESEVKTAMLVCKRASTEGSCTRNKVMSVLVKVACAVRYAVRYAVQYAVCLPAFSRHLPACVSMVDLASGGVVGKVNIQAPRCR